MKFNLELNKKAIAVLLEALTIYEEEACLDLETLNLCDNLKEDLETKLSYAKLG